MNNIVHYHCIKFHINSIIARTHHQCFPCVLEVVYVEPTVQHLDCSEPAKQKEFQKSSFISISILTNSLPVLSWVVEVLLLLLHQLAQLSNQELEKCFGSCFVEYQMYTGCGWNQVIRKFWSVTLSPSPVRKWSCCELWAVGHQETVTTLCTFADDFVGLLELFREGLYSCFSLHDDLLSLLVFLLESLLFNTEMHTMKMQCSNEYAVLVRLVLLVFWVVNMQFRTPSLLHQGLNCPDAAWNFAASPFSVPRYTLPAETLTLAAP